MAAQIRIARGNKANKSGGLLYGELFWEKTGSGELGTLYIGKPDGASGSDLAIGGARAMESLFYKGSLAGGSSFPAEAKTGDFWVMTADGTSALAEYKSGDWLVCIGTAQFTRINNSGGQADEISYVNTGTGLNATNVQDAVTDLAKLKMQYAGQINLATEAGILATPVVGGLYLVTQDGVEIAGMTPATTAIKGDWVFYDGAAWTHIPAGYTEADSTAFDNTGVTLADGSTAVIATNVQDALEDIYAHKADLVAGKIPVSQLPDSVVGGLQYQSTWDISGGSPALPTDTAVGHYYIIVGADNTPVVVGGISLTTGDWIVRDASGWQAVQGGGAVDAISVGSTHLQGDVSFAGSDKISVSPSGNIITVAGQNLVDFDSTIPTAEIGNVPRLVATTGRIGAGSIKDTGSVVDVAADFTVGSAQAIGTGTPKTTKLYGDVTIGATGESGSKVAHVLKLEDTAGNAASIKAPAVLGGNPIITVPSATGTLIVKDSATTADKLAKFTADGVVANSAISDNGSIVTIAEPVVVGSASTPQTLTVNGQVQVVDTNTEHSASLAAPALTSDVTIILPSASGTLATVDQLTQGVEGAIDGTAKTIAMFSDTHAVGDSIITQNATDDTITIAGKLKVGTAGAAQELNVFGATKFFNAAGDQSVTFTAPTVSSIQALPETDGTLLNSNSAVDGGEF